MAPTLVNRAQKLLAHISQLKEEVAALKELYATLLSPEFMVEDRQFQTWLKMYDFHVVVEGIESAAKRINRVEQEIEEVELDNAAAQAFNETDGEADWFAPIKPVPDHKTKLDMVKYASAAMRDIKKVNA